MPRVRPSNRVTKQERADTLPLVSRFDLDLSDLYRVGLLEQLDHADTLAINLDAVDTTARPAFGAMSQVPGFVPAAPRCEEQLAIDRPAQLLEP